MRKNSLITLSVLISLTLIGLIFSISACKFGLRSQDMETLKQKALWNKSHEVRKKALNELGLFDMSGNIWEWCWDWHSYYSSKAWAGMEPDEKKNQQKKFGTLTKSKKRTQYNTEEEIMPAKKTTTKTTKK